MVAAAATDVSPSRLFYIHDKNTSLQFLVHTGAQVSIIAVHKTEQLRQPSDLQLQAANGSTITTYGRISLTLSLGLRRSFPWVFIIADIPTSILGIDFLKHYNLLVDPSTSRLIDKKN